jgi:hypothetical protein
MKLKCFRFCILLIILITESTIVAQTYKELQEKIDKYEYLQLILEETSFDSLLIDEKDGLVLVRFNAPLRSDYIHLAWSRSSTPTPLTGLEGFFWCSYCDGRAKPLPKVANEIVVSDLVMVFIPCAPPSPVIKSIQVEGSPITPFYSDGDLWFSTWADDDNLYVGWGDGRGVILQEERSDCGIAKLSGSLPNISAEEICWRAPTPFPVVNDKPSSLLFFDKHLYGQFHSPLGDARIGYLAYSDDYGKNWTRVGFFEEGETPPEDGSPWTRDNKSPFRCLFFINMGKNYELAPDEYVYGLGIGTAWSWIGGVFLTRVKQENILNYEAYEYYTGMMATKIQWSSSPSDAVALPGVQSSSKGSAMFHPGLGRYLFFTTKALYDSPNPWGPWTFAGGWSGILSPEEWRNGYMPGIISKDTGQDYFWFTLSGQNYPPKITYRLQLGKMVMILHESTDIILNYNNTFSRSSNQHLFTLRQNYPNPFNSLTTINYQLLTSMHVKLIVYNIQGEEIKILVNELKEAGKHQAIWNGTNLSGKNVSSGLYLLRLWAQKQIETKKIMITK